jgi:NADH-quinone oxidoreductase subunit D
MSIEQTDHTLFDTSELTVSMGPQHPSTHGVLQVKLKLDGERVLDAQCVIGYLHRGVEKLGEHQTFGQFVPTLDRMDYISRRCWALPLRPAPSTFA